MPTDIAELTTIQDFIRWGTTRFNAAGLWFGHGTDNALDEAAWLVAHALQLPSPLPAQFYPCHLTTSERARIADLLERRISERRPAAYLTGQAWFAGLEFAVDERVMVPRSPLAELIEDQFAPWRDPEQIERVLDVCTGSGCIGLAIAVHLPHTEVDLVDLSAAALQVAAINVQRLSNEHEGLAERVALIQSDLFTQLNGRRYDMIISNPPYVSAADLISLPPEYQHEPQLAFAAGEHGLDTVQQLLQTAPNYLNDNGILLVEVGNSAAALEARFPDVPFTWLEFQRGGSGVFLLYKSQLVDYHHLF
ncbi:50S ribosomal protein L3 N(5)-glutamine methyltransferase [Thiospirillum jenense]|uniref:Ribosomal protein uL3 glutamine methyltransferase n=1 Tax=Thiospirillum jenense TaxID=1653858 RepID=A0A839HDA7_9GAMM|nr:50S ribosomal protein L3 N(5)-glutamine methyltransferase [Thiospirillum jenense]MBB1125167.1 50S ribosomal protein L3 N(5)-glutamine methyltransferase [Thiospirillum jenense]